MYAKVGPVLGMLCLSSELPHTLRKELMGSRLTNRVSEQLSLTHTGYVSQQRE